MSETPKRSMPFFLLVLMLLVGVVLGYSVGHVRSPAAKSETVKISGDHPAMPVSHSSTTIAETSTEAETVSTNTILIGAEYVRDVIRKSETGKWSGCMHAWREVTHGIKEDEIPALMAQVSGMRDKNTRQLARDALLARWAELNPSAALTAAGKIADTKEREAAEASVYAAWAEKDLDAVLAVVLQKPEGKKRNELLQSIIASAGTTNPERAFAAIVSNKLLSAMRYSISSIVAQWAKKNPQSAIQALAGRTTVERREIVEGIAQGWAETDRSSAIAWAIRLTSASERQSALRAVFSQMGDSNPELLISAFDQVTDKRSRNELIPDIARSLASENPQNAMAWCEKLPEGNAKTQAIRSIINEWSGENPAAAARYIMDKVSPNEREGMLSDVIREWQTADAKGATAFVESMTEPDLKLELTKKWRNHWRKTTRTPPSNWLKHCPAKTKPRFFPKSSPPWPAAMWPARCSC